MKKLLLLLLFLPVSLICQDDFPEWEKVEFQDDMILDLGAIVTNYKNDLFSVVSSGIYKSTDEGNNWQRLTVPDSLVYDGYKLLTLKNILLTYGKKYEYNLKYDNYNRYIVISYNNGETWDVIPFPIGSLYPDRWGQLIDMIDSFGNIWGHSLEEIKDPNGSYDKHYIFQYNPINKNKTIKFEIGNKFSFIKLIIEDSTVFAFFSKSMVFKDKYNNYLLIYRSDDLGQTWDTVKSAGQTAPYFEIKFGNEFSFTSTAIFSQNKLYLQLFFKGTMVIDLDNNTYEITSINSISKSLAIIKKSNSEFYLNGEGISYKWGFWHSKDTMKTWEEIIYNGFNPNNISIDSSNNIYMTGSRIFRLLDGDTLWNYADNGIYCTLEKNLKINSKSEIFLILPSSSMYYLKDNIWIIPNFKECGVDEYTSGFLSDDKLIIRKSGCGLVKTEYPFESFKKFPMPDGYNLFDLENWSQLNQEKFIGVTQKKHYYYSKDNAESWEPLEDFRKPDKGNILINKYEEFVLLSDSAQIFFSDDKGKSWTKILNDSLNYPYPDINLYDKIAPFQFNHSTGIGFIVYSSGIYITRDNGRSWKKVESNDSVYDFLSYSFEDRTTKLEMVTDPTTGYFYMGTWGGVYRSTDSLKSFHCISKGKVEPSVITELQLGNDGRLYAMNYRGIWRTKEKVINAVNDSKPDFNWTEFTIYPNPAEDFITIQTSEVLKPSEGYILQIFDLLGIEVISTSSAAASTSQEGNFKIDISKLAAGVYLVRIGDKVGKFVKN